MEDSEGVATPEVAGTDQPEFRLEFHYLKSNYFRVIRTDGVFGGVTPTGEIQMVLYSERLPIPDLMVHTLSEEGSVGPELRKERVSRDGLVREVETTTILDLETAEGLVEWLQGKIDLLSKRKQ